MQIAAEHIRSPPVTGRDMLVMSLSANDPDQTFGITSEKMALFAYSSLGNWFTESLGECRQYPATGQRQTGLQQAGADIHGRRSYFERKDAAISDDKEWLNGNL